MINNRFFLIVIFCLYMFNLHSEVFKFRGIEFGSYPNIMKDQEGKYPIDHDKDEYVNSDDNLFIVEYYSYHNKTVAGYNADAITFHYIEDKLVRGDIFFFMDEEKSMKVIIAFVKDLYNKLDSIYGPNDLQFLEEEDEEDFEKVFPTTDIEINNLEYNNSTRIFVDWDVYDDKGHFGVVILGLAKADNTWIVNIRYRDETLWLNYSKEYAQVRSTNTDGL